MKRKASCAQCFLSKTKCVFEEGETSCNRCKRTNKACCERKKLKSPVRNEITKTAVRIQRKQTNGMLFHEKWRRQVELLLFLENCCMIHDDPKQTALNLNHLCKELWNRNDSEAIMTVLGFARGHGCKLDRRFFQCHCSFLRTEGKIESVFFENEIDRSLPHLEKFVVCRRDCCAHHRAMLESDQFGVDLPFIAFFNASNFCKLHIGDHVVVREGMGTFGLSRYLFPVIEECTQLWQRIREVHIRAHSMNQPNHKIDMVLTTRCGLRETTICRVKLFFEFVPGFIHWNFWMTLEPLGQTGPKGDALPITVSSRLQPHIAPSNTLRPHIDPSGKSICVLPTQSPVIDEWYIDFDQEQVSNLMDSMGQRHVDTLRKVHEETFRFTHQIELDGRHGDYSFEGSNLLVDSDSALLMSSPLTNFIDNSLTTHIPSMNLGPNDYLTNDNDNDHFMMGNPNTTNCNNADNHDSPLTMNTPSSIGSAGTAVFGSGIPSNNGIQNGNMSSSHGLPQLPPPLEHQNHNIVYSNSSNTIISEDSVVYGTRTNSQNEFPMASASASTLHQPSPSHTNSSSTSSSTRIRTNSLDSSSTNSNGLMRSFDLSPKISPTNLSTFDSFSNGNDRRHFTNPNLPINQPVPVSHAHSSTNNINHATSVINNSNNNNNIAENSIIQNSPLRRGNTHKAVFDPPLVEGLILDNDDDNNNNNDDSSALNIGGNDNNNPSAVHIDLNGGRVISINEHTDDANIVTLGHSLVNSPTVLNPSPLHGHRTEVINPKREFDDDDSLIIDLDNPVITLDSMFGKEPPLKRPFIQKPPSTPIIPDNDQFYDEDDVGKTGDIMIRETRSRQGSVDSSRSQGSLPRESPLIDFPTVVATTITPCNKAQTVTGEVFSFLPNPNS